MMGTLYTAINQFFGGAASFETPDVTKAQRLALGQAIVAVLAAFGLDLSGDEQQLIIGLSAALGAALPISDALIRRARAANAEQIAVARGQTGEPTAPANRRRLLEALAELEEARL